MRGFLKEILRRPDNERPVLLIPVGYPAADATVPESRKKQLAEIAECLLESPPPLARSKGRD